METQKLKKTGESAKVKKESSLIDKNKNILDTKCKRSNNKTE